jgi:hypothetical protein
MTHSGNFWIHSRVYVSVSHRQKKKKQRRIKRKKELKKEDKKNKRKKLRKGTVGWTGRFKAGCKICHVS